MTLSRTPLYNLGAVLKETGIAADTLRAWERRYGVPIPRRTPGGHRLYSERDIALIKWLQARQAEGLSISRAADQWKNLVAAGHDPLEKPQAAGDAGEGHTSPYDGLRALRDQWLDACLHFDEAGAEQILNQAFARYSVEAATAGVLQSALHEVGEMWVQRQATVQQEHFLAGLTSRRLDTLIAASPPPLQPQVVVLACAEGEPHALPLQFINLFLRRQGRTVISLGANVPRAELVETVQAAQAALVALSAEQLATAAALRDEAALLAKKRILVAYGGRVFVQQPDLRKRIPGAYLGDDLAAAAGRIDQLLNEPPTSIHRLPPGPMREAEAFQEARTRIELNVHQRFATSPLPSRLLAVANQHFGPGLAAALELGNVTYLETDLQWIRTLLTSHGLPAKALRDYLTAYADAIRRVMGSTAAGTAGWIRDYAAGV